MFETGVRHIRFAVGTVSGRRLSTRNLAKLVDDALATLAEFGEPGTDAETMLGAPLPDPEEQLAATNRCLRRTARRLADRSPFYARRLAAAATDPRKLDTETLRAIPVTTKRDLVERAADFLCTDVQRYLSTRTTGTPAGQRKYGCPDTRWTCGQRSAHSARSSMTSCGLPTLCRSI